MVSRRTTRRADEPQRRVMRHAFPGFHKILRVVRIEHFKSIIMANQHGISVSVTPPARDPPPIGVEWHPPPARSNVPRRRARQE